MISPRTTGIEHQNLKLWQVKTSEVFGFPGDSCWTMVCSPNKPPNHTMVCFLTGGHHLWQLFNHYRLKGETVFWGNPKTAPPPKGDPLCFSQARAARRNFWESPSKSRVFLLGIPAGPVPWVGFCTHRRWGRSVNFAVFGSRTRVSMALSVR
jgi:hypothetical protein